MPTIVGDDFGGSVYAPPKPKPLGIGSMANVFGPARSREAPTGRGETGPRSGNPQRFGRSAKLVEPVETSTVIGDPFGGEVIPPKRKGKPLVSGRVGPGQSYSDPDHRQADRDFKDWSGGFGGLF